MIFVKDEQLGQELTDDLVFLAKIHSNSDHESKTVPSTPWQWDAARAIEQICHQIGLSDISLDERGVVRAHLASVGEVCPSVALLAHYDTSPDALGENVVPIVTVLSEDPAKITDIELPHNGTVLSAAELVAYAGCTIVSSSGNTLLGADDKAGCAVVLAIARRVVHWTQRPSITFIFTPDEEIGGTSHALLDGHVANLAFTLDGGEAGEISFECFTANSFHIEIAGSGIHPGLAGTVHAANAAAACAWLAVEINKKYIRCDQSVDRQGFVHITNFSGTMDSAVIGGIIRDFSTAIVSEASDFIREKCQEMEELFGVNVPTIDIKSQYSNMHDAIKSKAPWLREALTRATDSALNQPGRLVGSGDRPLVNDHAIRGGTDGAFISFAGTPCPNVFAGMHNFHSVSEFAVVEEMEASVRTILEFMSVELPKAPSMA